MTPTTRRFGAATAARFSRRLNRPAIPTGVELGVRQSGTPLVLPRPDGDPQHVLLSGTTGSGKSAFQRTWAAALAEFDDVAMIGLDPKRTALGSWGRRFTVVAKSIGECTQTLVWLWGETERRLEIMESLDVDEWRVDYGGPFIVVFIDELVQVSSIDGAALVGHMNANLPAAFNTAPSQVTTGANRARPRSKELRDAMTEARTNQRAQGVFLSALARLCRSAGVQIIAATQYPMSDVVDPQVRANLDLRVMLRVPSNEMVKVCLGDQYSDDITADSISRDERGGCWISGIGTRPVRARGYWVATHQGRDRAKQTQHLRWAPADVFVGQDLGHLAPRPDAGTAEATTIQPTPPGNVLVPGPMSFLNTGHNNSPEGPLS